jgi:ankyrin repeat protein
LASMMGLEAVVRLLLEQGADIEAKDHNGQTALLLASMMGCEVVVRLLQETK